MAAAGLTAYKLYRTLWPQKAITEAVFNNFPELGLLPKDTSFYEKVRQIAVGMSGPQGIGSTFTTAKANKTASTAVEFTCATKPLYALFSLEGDLMRRAKNDKALLVDPIKREAKLAIRNWKLEVAKAFYGNGGGSLARSTTATSAASQTFTVSDPRDLRFIWPKMKLQSASTDGTSGTVNPGAVTVATVNRAAGTFTIEEASIISAIPGFVNTDYLFRESMFGAIFPGFEAWNPATAPSATLFRGVDRSVDTDMLGGLRLDVSTKSPRAKAKALANAVYDNGGEPDLYILHTSDWADLEADLDSAGSLTRMTAPATKIGTYDFGMSYEAIKMTGPNGPITVVASPNAKAGVGRMLTKSTWILGSMGELLHDIDENNTEDGADAKEFRMLGDLDFYCDFPGHNARGVL